MADITMCKTPNCPISHLCYRKTAVPDEFRQAYATFHLSFDNSGRVSCGHFYDNRKVDHLATGE